MFSRSPYRLVGWGVAVADSGACLDSSQIVRGAPAWGWAVRRLNPAVEAFLVSFANPSARFFPSIPLRPLA